MDFKTFFSPENITNLASNLAIIIFSLVLGWKQFCKKIDELKSDEPKRVRGNLKYQSEIDSRIYNKLEELKEVLGADRVQLYDFHNGIHYANGRSAMRISCTYEACRYGVKSYQNQLSSLPISCLPNFISDLLKYGEFKCKDLESIRESHPATYSFKKSMQITAFYDIVFHNTEGEVIGFIAVQFCNNKELVVDKTEIAKCVGYVEAELASLLNNDTKGGK